MQLNKIMDLVNCKKKSITILKCPKINTRTKKNNNQGKKEFRSKPTNNKRNTTFTKKNKKNEQTNVVSYCPKSRKTKEIKKTIEVANPEGDKDWMKAIRLDNESTFQEIVDTLREFNMFHDENDLHGDCECEAAGITPKQTETAEKLCKRQ